MTIRSGFLVATVVALALATAQLSAHDFWIGASSWSPDPGTPFGISAGVGEHFPDDAYPVVYRPTLVRQ